MLDVVGLRKLFFPGTASQRVALDGLDLSLPSGSFCVVVGSNGAGKSTLLNAIAGTTSVDSGSIRIDGQDVARLPPERRAGQVSRVFQDPMTGTAAGMTIEENLLLAELRGGHRRLRWGLTAARRGRYRDRLAVLGLGLENRLTEHVDLLSGGQRQAVSLVMAICGNPRLLLLDEHTAALDPATAAAVMQATWQVVDEARLTTLMVTHNMQHAIDHGDRLIMLDAGRIRFDTTGDEKRLLTIPDLVARFRQKDDRVLLAG
jgi:putative tryptophan/tyrosine transport system ATP-binding protein